MKKESRRNKRDQRVQRIGARARQQAGALAGELVRADDGQRELILDEMTFHRDLADMADVCLET